MGYWNYRIVRRENRYADGTLCSYEPYIYGLHEAHYNQLDELCSVTMEPVSIIGESFESLHSSMNWILKAFDKPVIDMETQVWAPYTYDEEDNKIVSMLEEMEDGITNGTITDERRKEIEDYLDSLTSTEDLLEELTSELDDYEKAELRELNNQLVGRKPEDADFA